MTVVHVVGARPNYMKVAPVYAALEANGNVDQRLIHTGQHYDAAMNDVFFAQLPLPRPHVELEVRSGTHAAQTARALEGLEQTFLDLRPDLVLVPGDINSTLAGALAAVKLGIPVCHLEAGLRSFDWGMPEEHNRKIADHTSSLLLAPSADAVENLSREGISGDAVQLIGNTMIDTLFANLADARRARAWSRFGLVEGAYALVTLHRPALVDHEDLLRRTIRGLGVLAQSLPVVFPIHPRTLARAEALGLAAPQGVVFAPPLPYLEFLSLEAGAGAVVTDSGGIQEETTALGIPCFTLRANTERPVTITHGTNTLLGLEPDRLGDVPGLLRRRRPSRRVPPLWDGAAGGRAAAAIESYLLGCSAQLPVEESGARPSSRLAVVSAASS
jgi:UDP-N-acetylglucosamine 2-epimerase (non-hydrolysing)